jgi:hypothetical protein
LDLFGIRDQYMEQNKALHLRQFVFEVLSPALDMTSDGTQCWNGLGGVRLVLNLVL